MIIGEITEIYWMLPRLTFIDIYVDIISEWNFLVLRFLFCSHPNDDSCRDDVRVGYFQRRHFYAKMGYFEEYGYKTFMSNRLVLHFP